MIIVGFLAVFVPGLYLSATRSDAFEAAEYFARNSPEVIGRVGEVSRVSIRFWDGFYVTHSGSGGEASFVLTIKGERDEGVLDVRLRRAANVWHVDYAYLTTKIEQGLPIKSPQGL